MLTKPLRSVFSAMSRSRNFVLLADSLSWVASIFLAALLRLEFRLGDLPLVALATLAVFVVLVSLPFGFITHVYRNRFIKGSFEEAARLASLAAIVTFVAGVAVFVWGNQFGLPRSVVLISGPIFLLISGAVRAWLRMNRTVRKFADKQVPRALIYGAGDAGEILVTQLLASSHPPFIPVALIDDDPDKRNLQIKGVDVEGGWPQMARIAAKWDVDVVIVAIPAADSKLLSKVYADCRELDMRVLVLPTLGQYLEGRISSSDLRNVRIEDLVGRQSVVLDVEPVAQLIRSKRVLVTGAGGSIGSELSKQLAGFQPELVILLDRDETGLLETSMAISRMKESAETEMYLADIRDKGSVERLFVSRKPDIVFHAAALKHLSILENFPEEAWKTNVKGTLSLLEAAKKTGVEVFVNISTDKAANPVNVLGRTKKIGEDLTAWFSSELQKPYVSVRFGNVLGSRGSLIPIISEQIAAGGPVTITDKDASRFFMSIPEACNLVLQAAAQGKIGELMVLDMGNPVNISEIAERMIELSGIPTGVVFTGLRPGEKLHEDLLSENEELLVSSHPRIMRVKVSPRSPEEVLSSGP